MNESLRQDLEAAVAGEVRFDRISRGIHSTDAGPYQIIPAGVVVPRSRDDVVETLRICREHGISITARGGGTSQAGQTVGEGVQLDFSKYLRRILELDVEAGWVRVEPGIVVTELNAQLQPHGWELPLDLSTANRATLGGMIANNSSGTRSVVYGMTADYVDELEMLLSDGSIVTMGPLDSDEVEARSARDDLEGHCYRTVRRLARDNAEEIRKRFPAIFRRVGGYSLNAFLPGPDGAPSPPAPIPEGLPQDDRFNLSRLVAGSEGTLGLILSAKLRLVRPRKARVIGVAQFATLADALTATPAILEHGPSAVEVMDRPLLEMTGGKPEFEPLRDFIVGDPGAILIIEFMGDAAEALLPRLDALQADLGTRGLSTPLHRAIDGAAQARVWKLRQAGLGLSMSQTGDTKGVSFVEDTAVAPGQLTAYIARFQEILDRHGAKAVFYAHASVGLMHVRPAIDMKTAAGVERFRTIAGEVADLVLEFGGSLSAEHGDGMTRSPFQERMFGPVLYDAFRQVKSAFDPDGILNPGKIVDPPPITANLRYGPEYPTRELPTLFSFDDFGGISRAAEQCGGVGACRKTVTGTMCPSYMATREEADNTRGRATALRLAISGQMGFSGLADPALHPILDLCFECKACKTECPTGVDMARMKSEFLYQYQKEHGTSLRSRLLAGAETAAIWGSRLAPVSNWVLGSGAMRWLGELLLGLDRRRRFPRSARTTFLDWWGSWSGAASGGSGSSGSSGSSEKGGGAMATGAQPPRVAIFADTFTNFYEPTHPQAAVRVAETLGHEVTVPPRVCCGRPLISKGFLEEAREQAEATVRALAPLAEEGTPIVFCEPGCFSAVKDDHPLLVRPEFREAARRVAASALTFEEWAAGALAASGVTPTPLPGGPQEILIHGHCHQKALVGMGPTQRLLEQIPGATVTVLDTACCGMAGSFGYEKEHFEISVAAAERRLLPALRDAEPQTPIVAPGFSCRHQIRDLGDARPQSTMELLDRLLTTPRR